jgi:RNA polymerase sigma-70 factor (ECF subfamily)
MATDPDSISPALDQLLARFGETVRRVAGRHGLADEADDVLQEVRIRLWRARASGERIESANASYVYRTAVTAALDLIRRRRARKEDLMDPTTFAARATASAEPTPGDAVESAEMVRQVERAVDGLSPARRPVVRMYLAGYRQDEIADLMGWSEPKTRNLLYRGLADLRGRLTELGIGPEGTP